MKKYKRIFTIVIDSFGAGEMPDAAQYGDEGTDTMGHISQNVDEFTIPNLQKLGIANLHPLKQVAAVGRATGVEDFWTGDRISSADYMMLGIAGYCGILVMVLCIAIIAGLLCWFLRSALKQKNQLGMMMGFGCVMVLAIQFLLSLLANIGVSRFGQGAWCLFFGYGRSGQMVSAVLMGILLSIYRHQNVTPELVVEKRAVAS